MESRKRARFEEPVLAEDFAELQTPHPYGVLPGGNQFFNASSSKLPENSWYGLTEAIWNHVVAGLDGFAVGRLSSTSKFFYVLCHQPEVWRDLCLAENKVLDDSVVGRSWKETYVQIQGKHCNHVPMRISGIYSETLFRQHSCRSFSIPRQWYSQEDGNVPCVHVNEMTPEIFLEQYERPNRPVLIRGACRSWTAFERWKQPEYLSHHTDGRTFRATSGAAPQAAQFTFGGYQNYCQFDILEEGPLYLFDRTALAPNSTLWKDFYPDLQRTCEYWNPDTSYHDLFKVLGEGRRPDHTWLICGPQRSGSVFHIDPNCTQAWNANLLGRKRWFFYPPGVAPPGVYPSQDGDQVTLPVSIGEWLFEYYESHCSRKEALEITAMPGDILYVPYGWWHSVVNLDDLNVAITHNYVSESNLADVLKFLSTKRDQVSGCRDRIESVKPNALYETFVQELQKSHAKALSNARSVQEWQCRAWKTEPAKCHGSIMEKAKTTTAFSFGFV